MTSLPGLLSGWGEASRRCNGRNGADSPLDSFLFFSFLLLLLLLLIIIIIIIIIIV